MARTSRHAVSFAIALLMGLGTGFVFSVASSNDAFAQSSRLDRAKEHYQRGSASFSNGDYRTAIKHFTIADSLAPAPLLEYNMGLAHEKLGENTEALRRFRSYRVRAPNAANGAEVDAKIAKLEAAIAVPENPPVSNPPVSNPPVSNPPVSNPPVSNPPVSNPPVSNPPVSNPPVSSAPKTYAPTGDASLDRVAAVDLNQVSARHPSVAAQPSAAAAISPDSGEPGGPDGPAVGGAVTAPVSPKDGGEKPKPLYKRWWFWVVVGVSALILIDIARSDSGENTRIIMPSALDPSLGAPAAEPGGYTFRF